jgi:hypothetical protein
MNERLVTWSFFIPGTTTANSVLYVEAPFPWTLLGVKAASINDSDATLAASGGATITAAVIGDGDPEYLEPDSPPDPVDKDTLVALTLDYDGSSGTAAQDVSITVFGLVGDG